MFLYSCSDTDSVLADKLFKTAINRVDTASEGTSSNRFTDEELSLLYLLQNDFTLPLDRAMWYAKEYALILDDADGDAGSRSVSELRVVQGTAGSYSGARRDSLLYIFNYDRGRGFMVMSADERFPEVLTYATQGTLGNTISNPGIAVLLSHIPPFLNSAIDSVEQLRERETYKSLLSKLGIADKNKAPIMMSRHEEGEEGCVEESWPIAPSTMTVVGSISPMVQVRWSQGDPYNKYMRQSSLIGLGFISSGERSFVGCGPVAVGQVLSYHKKPASFGGYTFDWSGITAKSTIRYLDPEFQTQLARLLWLLGRPRYLDVSTYSGGTATTINRCQYAFDRLGYYAYLKPYGFNTIKSSLYAGKPCIAQGFLRKLDLFVFKTIDPFSGHIWVVDGYERRRWTGTKKYTMRCRYDSEFDQEWTVSWVKESQFFHANYGWGVGNDGADFWQNAVIYGSAFRSQHGELINNVDILYGMMPRP